MLYTENKTISITKFFLYQQMLIIFSSPTTNIVAERDVYSLSAKGKVVSSPAAEGEGLSLPSKTETTS